MMGTWLPETCWATCKREIKDKTKVTSSWFLIHTAKQMCILRRDGSLPSWQQCHVGLYKLRLNPASKYSHHYNLYPTTAKSARSFAYVCWSQPEIFSPPPTCSDSNLRGLCFCYLPLCRKLRDWLQIFSDHHHVTTTPGFQAIKIFFYILQIDYIEKISRFFEHLRSTY